MKFIAILFLLYFAFRLFSVVAVRFLSYKIRKSGMYSGNENEKAEDLTTKKNKKKVIQKDEGDYVEFEEIDKKS